MAGGHVTSVIEFNGGLNVLQNKGLYQEVRQIAGDLPNLSSFNSRENRFQQDGWTTEYVANIRNRKPRFNAFKAGVAIEYVAGKKRSQVRSDLLCLVSAYRDAQIHVGVVITSFDSPTHGKWIMEDIGGGILADFIFGEPLVMIESS